MPLQHPMQKSTPNPMIGILCIGISCLFVVTACSPDPAANAELGMLQSGAAVAGARAPDFLLKDLGLTPVRLSDFRGSPVVLNFFASWCGPCLIELPLLQAAHLNATDRSYVIFGVATQDSRGAIEVLADDMQLTFPIVIDGDNSVTRAYRVIGPPYTFFIDANGTVIDVIPGALKQDRLDQLLDKLIATASADAA
jgi:peroxiredoxin